MSVMGYKKKFGRFSINFFWMFGILLNLQNPLVCIASTPLDNATRQGIERLPSFLTFVLLDTGASLVASVQSTLNDSF